VLNENSEEKARKSRNPLKKRNTRSARWQGGVVMGKELKEEF